MIFTRSLLSITAFSLSITLLSAQEPSYNSEAHVQHAQQWAQYLATHLDVENLQLASNVMYLLYANAVIDIKIRQFIIPITRLNQSIRTNIFTYKDTAKELTTLKTLLDRLSFVAGARTIYNQMLKTCLDYYNNHQSPLLTQAIVELQNYGQNALNEVALAKSNELGEQFKLSFEILSKSVLPLESIGKIHNEFADGSVIKSLQSNETTRGMAGLITVDELLKNNMVAMQNAEHVLNTLDKSTEILLNLMTTATDIYHYHYAALYNHLSSETFDQSRAVTLFGINDVLPEEYRSTLPDPEKVFDHILQTIKLYTQAEIIQ